MHTTKGTALLLQLVTPKQHTQASIARALGVTSEAVRHWCTGATKPKDKLRKKLERLTGIPSRSWEEPSDASSNDVEKSGEAA